MGGTAATVKATDPNKVNQLANLSHDPCLNCPTVLTNLRFRGNNKHIFSANYLKLCIKIMLSSASLILHLKCDIFGRTSGDQPVQDHPN